MTASPQDRPAINPEHNVGERLRSLRRQQGLTLRALAARCGLSTTAISQIERGENSPTVSSLHQLATALGVSIIDLFQNEHRSAIVLVRPESRLRSETRGVITESLGVGLPYQQLEPFMITVAPGAGNADEPVVHAGEEFVHCLAGALDYYVAGQAYRLGPGDSLIFQATQPHCFHNPTPEPARLILIFQAGGAPAVHHHAKAAYHRHTASMGSEAE